MSGEQTAYVGRCHGCKAIIAVVYTGVVDVSELAEMVAEMITDGLLIEPSYDMEFGFPPNPCCEVGSARQAEAQK